MMCAYSTHPLPCESSESTTTHPAGDGPPYPCAAPALMTVPACDAKTARSAVFGTFSKSCPLWNPPTRLPYGEPQRNSPSSIGSTRNDGGFTISGGATIGGGVGCSTFFGRHPSRITASHSPRYTYPRLFGHFFSACSCFAMIAVCASHTPVSGKPTVFCHRLSPSIHARGSPARPLMDSCGPSSGP